LKTPDVNKQKTVILKQTLITIMVTSIYVFGVVVNFTHFKWLKGLICLIITQF